MRWLRLVVLLPALLSCSWFDGSGPSDGLTLLRLNRDRWKAIGRTTYSMNYQLGCFCLWDATRPVRIEVNNGSIVGVYALDTDQPLSPNIHWPTVDSLFARAERDLIAGYKMSITYDATYHFPRVMSGDYPGTVDDEYSVTAVLLSDLASVQR